MKILSLETSCDETAAALISAEKDRLQVLSSVVSSQIKLHAKWGGVVPNLAAREHLKNILPVISTCLDEAGVSPENIDLIAVTNGPGLIPALLIGTNTARTLAYVWKKPILGIHHIEGHIYANFISDEVGASSKIENRKSKQKTKATNQGLTTKNSIRFPVLCLVVSGGHTQLVLMEDHFKYKIVGQTLDDAAGEAFDKVARILGLGYPGGPAIAAEAAKFLISDFQFQNKSKLKNSKIDSKFKIQNSKFILPRPMINSDNLNFSFSGLKTAVLYLTKKNQKKLKNKLFIQTVCYEFQQAVIDVLVAKTVRAIRRYKPRTVMLAGGVSANRELRQQLGEAVGKEAGKPSYIVPELCYSIDNAAMIGAAAYFRLKKAKRKLSPEKAWQNIPTDANLKLK